MASSIWYNGYISPFSFDAWADRYSFDVVRKAGERKEAGGL